MNADKRLYLLYTERDWRILEEMSQTRGAKSFNAYLHNKMHALVKIIKHLDSSKDDFEVVKRRNNFPIPAEISNQLYHIAKVHCVPLSSVVRWYISDPLIKEFYERGEFTSK